jgi:hypothetical protein
MIGLAGWSEMGPCLDKIRHQWTRRLVRAKAEKG